MAPSRFVMSLACAAALVGAGFASAACAPHDAAAVFDTDDAAQPQTQQARIGSAGVNTIDTQTTEPITAQAAFDGYEHAVAVLTGTIDTTAMDDALLADLLEVYYDTADAYDAAREAAGPHNAGLSDADPNDTVLFGDAVSEGDAVFLDLVYDEYGFAQRVIVPDDDPAQKYDLIYYALVASLADSEEVARQTMTGVDELVSTDDVALNEQSRSAVIPLADVGSVDAQMRYIDGAGVWKLAMTREYTAQLSNFGQSMLQMMAFNGDGDTNAEKAESLVEYVRTLQDKRSAARNTAPAVQ